MAHFYRLILAFVLAAVSSSAFAVIPYVAGPMGWRVDQHGVAYGFTTKQIACTTWAATGGYNGVLISDDTGCRLDPGTYSRPLVTSPTRSCPAGTSDTPAGCVCNQGTTENATHTACVPDSICLSLAGMPLPESQAMAKIGNASTATITGIMKQTSFAFCDSTGCMAQGKAIAGGTFGGQSFVTVDSPKFTGTSCDQTAAAGVSTPQDSPQLCKAGTCPGTVNGVENCYPCTTGITATDSTTTSGGTSTTPGGTSTSSTTENKTTITVCEGSTCTTTTTTRGTSTIGGTPTGTVQEQSKTESLSDFCKANPKADLCKSTVDSTFSGACGAAPSCSGDAILCAIAAESLKAACALNPAASDESALYASEKGKTGSQTGQLPGNDTVEIGSGSFSSEAVLGAGACITDKTVTVMGSSISLPFSSVCPWLDSLRALLLGVSWLAAFAIVFKQTA